MDGKTKKMMIMNKELHPKNDIDRFCQETNEEEIP